MNIALVGNPNSGKTSLFNLLTGSNQYVGNWPGVTVEKKEGSLKKIRTFIFRTYPASILCLLIHQKK
ncbi:TPA: ferrous iron transporter B [Enterococcus faecium]|nr:ferrous iron transporter B [Enterococcus faecium]ELA58456.1 ferrous iron transporter B [Enterococcus faecium EnGen0022]ELB22692.1 ferrous iron transporter B [Enterococcus faecium EnGen0039]ELB59866.1 ferrous iron transporter B [Enterococcus faecium EnGen0052]UNQ07230.1 50S ribosome-binding GTPase [Enterococcus faecalis]